MKAISKSVLIFILIWGCFNTAYGQSKKEKQAAKAAALKKMVDEQRFVFDANYANPQRGGNIQLTSLYDLKITKDTISAYLPYYGRAYVGPTDPNEGAINFTNTNFTYSTAQRKKGGWDILIKPKGQNITAMTDIQQLQLSITPAGYATLSIISTNRDFISFDGTIESVKSSQQ